MELLKADAAKELEAPRCYIPIWVPVESPSERIQRAKDELAATGITEGIAEVSNDTSGKDTDSNGKKEPAGSGLSPTTKATKSPKPQRERKKSKSKGGEEKSVDEGEKIEKAEGPAAPKTPPKVDSAGDSKSPAEKKSPEKSSKSPKKSVGEEEPNTVQN